ncbi:MAG: hypothetical protein BWX72_01741 [Firmicutes bacterium ADurb.Bin080]|jgi:hypothetical protein|nr:MAG: hypothetical protein BWX72_01741 [Firmicutes bacterium ADurb.Bin080]
MKKKKNIIEDDGRVIAPMNVDGMPWYNNQMPSDSSSVEKSPSKNKMGSKETLKMIFRLYGILLPIALLFIGLFALFIVFTGHVWLK